MPGLYTHTTRIAGELIDATKYNADHQNHIDNLLPTKIDDYEASVGQMQAQTDPGGVGSEALATTLAGELERLRYVIARLAGVTYWYDNPTWTPPTGYQRKKATTTLPCTNGAAYLAWTQGIPDNARVLSIIVKNIVAPGASLGLTGYHVGDTLAGGSTSRWSGGAGGAGFMGLTQNTQSDQSMFESSDMPIAQGAQDVRIAAIDGTFDGTGTIGVAVYYELSSY